MSGGQGKDKRKQRSPSSSSSSASQSAVGEQNGGKSRRDSAAAARALKSKASTGGKNGTNEKAESKKAQAKAKPHEEDVDDVAEKGDSASEEEDDDDDEEEEEEDDDEEEGSDSDEEDESSKSGKGEAPEAGKGTSESLKAATPPMATPKAASSAGKQATAPGNASATQASVPAKGVRQDVPLIVSGCVNTTISDIIKGTYYPHSTNHGKVVYKKQLVGGAKEGSSLEVQIYYWDERDGAELCGWWFGPSVGGEMVWAYHPSRKATTPPAAEWNVPHDGPIDPQFSVTAAKPGDVKKASKAAAPAAAKEAPAAQQVDVGASPGKAAAAAAAAAAAKEEKAARKEEPEKKKSKRDPNQKEEKRGKVDDSVKQAEERAKQEEEQKKQEGVPKEEKSKEQKSKDRTRKKGQKADVEEKEGKEVKEKGKQAEEACNREDEEKGKRAGKKGKKDEAKGKKEEGKSNKEEKGNEEEEKSKKEEKEANKQEDERSSEQVPELPHAEGTAASTQNFFVNAYKKRMEERAREEEATKKKKVKEGKESKSKDAKEVKEMKDKTGKDAKDIAEGSEAKKAKGAKETKDAKDGKGGQERKESKPPGKQAKTSKGASKDASKDIPKETAQEAPKETKKEAKEGKEAKEVKAPKDAKEQGKDTKQRDDKKEEKRKNDKEKKLREEKLKLQKDAEEQKEEEEDDEDAQSGQEEKEPEHEKKKRKVDHKVEKVAERKRERDSKLRDDAKQRKRKDKSCDEDEESLRRPDRRKRRRERRRCSSDDEPATYKSRRRRRSEDRRRRNDSEDDDPPRRRDEKERRRPRDDRREEDRRRRDDSGGSRGRQEDRARKREEGRREHSRDPRDREKDAEKGKQHEKEEKQQLADRKERPDEEKAASDAGTPAKSKAKLDEEAAGGKDLEAKALRQQQATLAVLSCFQKLTDVSLETFEDAKAEFDRVIKNDLPDTGAQQDILRAEATRVFGHAQNLVEEMKEKSRLEEASRQKREGKVPATGEDKQEAQEVEVIQDAAPPPPEETEEERAARREEERKRKEDERRRHEAELQRKREERRRKEREAHEKEEEKKKAERDARKKEEEEKKRQEEEKSAEERRLKEEVDQKKNKEESKVRREQQATLAVLRGLQKLSDASPDNFEALRTEFEKVMTVELPDTGAQQDMLKAEADRVFGYAQRYVEQVKAQKKQSVQEEAQKQEKAKELLAEFQKLLVAVESETGKVQSVAATLTSEQKLPDEEVLRVSKAVRQAAEKATGACAACTQFLELKRQNILEAESTREESVKVLSLGQARNQTALQQISEAMKTANNSRDRIAKSIAPMLWANKASDLFHKYDIDGDGFLSRAEVQAFAKLEYNFALPAENLDRIFRQLAEPGSLGLPSTKFQHLKTAVGIARHEDRCRLRRLSPEERKRREQADAAICEAVAAERRSAWKATCASMQREVDSLEPVVAAAESLGEEFHAAASQVKAKALLAKAVEVETKLTPGQSQLTKVQRLARGVRKDMQDLKETMAEDHAHLCGKVDDLGIRLKKVIDSVANRKQQILTKAFEKYESLRLDVAGKLRACIEALGGKAVDLFQVVNRAGGEKVSTDDVRHFLRENQCDLEPEKLDKVFFACASGYIMDDEDDVVPPNSVLRIGREDFMRIIRVYCKVVKEIILSDNLLIDQSEQIRRMEVGEVMEVFQGPVNEPAVNVLRIHGRVLSDGQVGWVTISGKDGNTFLVPGGNVFRVTRPCAVSEDLHGVKTTRMSIVGEVLEVLDWSRTSRSAVGITRVRARARADGVIGWVTLLDSGTNTRYLEVV